MKKTLQEHIQELLDKNRSLNQIRQAHFDTTFARYESYDNSQELLNKRLFRKVKDLEKTFLDNDDLIFDFKTPKFEDDRQVNAILQHDYDNTKYNETQKEIFRHISLYGISFEEVWGFDEEGVTPISKLIHPCNVVIDYKGVGQLVEFIGYKKYKKKEDYVIYTTHKGIKYRIEWVNGQVKSKEELGKSTKQEEINKLYTYPIALYRREQNPTNVWGVSLLEKLELYDRQLNILYEIKDECARLLGMGSDLLLNSKVGLNFDSLKSKSVGGSILRFDLPIGEGSDNAMLTIPGPDVRGYDKVAQAIREKEEEGLNGVGYNSAILGQQLGQEKTATEAKIQMMNISRFISGIISEYYNGYKAFWTYWFAEYQKQTKGIKRLGLSNGDGQKIQISSIRNYTLVDVRSRLLDNTEKTNNYYKLSASYGNIVSGMDTQEERNDITRIMIDLINIDLPLTKNLSELMGDQLEVLINSDDGDIPVPDKTLNLKYLLSRIERCNDNQTRNKAWLLYFDAYSQQEKEKQMQQQQMMQQQQEQQQPTAGNLSGLALNTLDKQQNALRDRNINILENNVI